MVVIVVEELRLAAFRFFRSNMDAAEILHCLTILRIISRAISNSVRVGKLSWPK